MKKGDVLYMPKGVVHYAQTHSSDAVHLTIGFHRGNLQWHDVLRTLIVNLTASGQDFETFASLLHVKNNAKWQQTWLQWQASDAKLQSKITEATRVLDL